MIRVKDISKKFGAKSALQNVSIESILEGQVFGLLGPNGAGKTTLIRILNQIILQDTGIIEFQDRPLRQSDIKQFGYLPEERGLYKSMRVLEHLIFLARLKGFSAKEASEKSTYWLDRFKIKEWSNKRIEQLSKGMSQKVQFIGSIVHDPQVLILDEPMSGFDPLNIQLMLELIEELKSNGKTILLSTHNMQSVEDICDRVALIDDAQKVVEDTVWNLRQENKENEFDIVYKGSKVAFATGLWIGFEIVQQKDLGEDRQFARVKKRRDFAINDLMSSLMNKVEIESISESFPSMQEVFVRLISEKKEISYA